MGFLIRLQCIHGTCNPVYWQQWSTAVGNFSCSMHAIALLMQKQIWMQKHAATFNTRSRCARKSTQYAAGARWHLLCRLQCFSWQHARIVYFLCMIMPTDWCGSEDDSRVVERQHCKMPAKETHTCNQSPTISPCLPLTGATLTLVFHFLAFSLPAAFSNSLPLMSCPVMQHANEVGL